MLDKIIKTTNKLDENLTFEIGSNSDLILENTITDNLVWTIEKFSKSNKGKLTFPTKFDMVDSILPLNHKGKIIIRMSVNPEEIIKKVERGTSPLKNRIDAINKLKESYDKLINLSGLGKKSIDNLLEAIEFTSKINKKNIRKTINFIVFFIQYSFFIVFSYFYQAIHFFANFHFTYTPSFMYMQFSKKNFSICLNFFLIHIFSSSSYSHYIFII